MMSSVPLNGRRAQAARNDQRILDAARAVFTADPGAPIVAVAEHAGVGISALYRRYRSKEDLLQRLCLDGLQRYIDAAEAALADDGDPWTAFTHFMCRCLDAGTGSLTLRFAGTFSASEELHRAGRQAHEATQRLLDRAKAAGALRADIEVGDLSLLFEQLQAVQVGDERRTSRLRHRYLTLLLDALHAASASPLPGPAPAWDEISGRYNR
ncbi:MAG TPA: helix-turn-helix domain-containing protein [Chloroflexota bacterium]|nr:helix-turn-helix domain-containing protein [Chloroflexota bacterium]